ncbi:hypothetical protein LIER_07490 [Lithospermum erythrorhizon]|uniref:Uncharacterized protein n=1 Tax=Lithospermum erythrorhizon TaxID=34254 RepID=A0AAV3P9E0_LITER
MPSQNHHLSTATTPPPPPPIPSPPPLHNEYDSKQAEQHFNTSNTTTANGDQPHDIQDSEESSDSGLDEEHE